MEKDKKAFSVDGFIFEDANLANQARKESEAIKYVKSRTDMENPDMVLEVYQRLLHENMFETPVGYNFLKELQEYLITTPYIKSSEISMIPVKKMDHSQKRSSKSLATASQKRIKQKKFKNRTKRTMVPVEYHMNYKKRYHAMAIVTVVLATVVMFMFAITLTSNNTNILNYENQVINKYEEWKNQLDEREKKLDEREQALDNAT